MNSVNNPALHRCAIDGRIIFGLWDPQPTSLQSLSVWVEMFVINILSSLFSETLDRFHHGPSRKAGPCEDVLATCSE